MLLMLAFGVLLWKYGFIIGSHKMVDHESNGARTVEGMETGTPSFVQGLEAIAAEFELPEEALGKIKDLAAVTLGAVSATLEDTVVPVEEKVEQARKKRTFTLSDIRSEDQLLMPSEVADLLRVNPRTVTRWSKIGRLTCIKTIGGHRRFTVADVRRAIAEAQAETGTDSDGATP